MAALAVGAGVQPSEYGRLKPGQAQQLATRVAEARAAEAQMWADFATEAVKAICKQIADGDSAVIRQIGELVKALNNTLMALASR